MQKTTPSRPQLAPEKRARLRWVWSLGGLSARDLANRVWANIGDHDDLGRAAQLAYYFVLALSPLLIFLSSLLGMFFAADRAQYQRFLEYLSRVMPESAYALVQTVMSDITSGAGGGTLSLGLAVTLWTASLAVEALIRGLNVAYGVREFRPWWRRRALAVALTAVLAIITSSALTLLLWGDRIRDWLAGTWGLGGLFLIAWSTIQWVYIAAVVLLALNVVYIFGPNLRQQRWQAIMPGSIAALLMWLAASGGFRIYLAYFDAYAKTYGSLGAMIVLLVWLYLSGFSMLAGGEVNAVILQAAVEAGVPPSDLPAEAREEAGDN
jgi:membrane protein